MSEEPKCQHPQSSTLQQAGAAPSRQQTESASDPAAFYRARTAVDREPHTPTTTYLSPSASRQSAGLNTPSEASSASLQTNFPASPSATGTTFRRISPADWLKREHEALKQRLQHLPYPGDRRPRLPTAADFPHALQVQIIPPFFEEHIEHVVVLLHQYGGSESSLNLARKLHKQQPETSFVLLPRIEAMSTPKSGYHWADTTGDWDGPFLNSVGILTDKILFPLIEACGFLPREIVLMGHGQGGKAVLGTAALWEDVELGGAVSIGGPLPSYVQPTFAEKIKTPALMIWGTSGDRTPVSLERIRSRFVCVDDSIFSGAHDTLPDTDESMKPLAEFLSHRLQREEWKRQAIISLGIFHLYNGDPYLLIID